MVTPELIKYIREELAKGKARPEIHRALDAQGGWNEADLSEAFRIITPEQSFVPGDSSKRGISSSSWHNLIFIVIGLGCILAWWFYAPQIMNFWNSSLESVRSLPFLSSYLRDTDDRQVAPESFTASLETRDCGSAEAPNLETYPSYTDNGVLRCLGQGALVCEDTKAILTSDLFPPDIEIIRSQNTCYFKLAYPEDSALVDITGKKLAGQYVTCPLSTVRTIGESDSPAVLRAAIPEAENLGQYGSQIYFYGALGLFMGADFDKDEIHGLGCTGSYIDSMIASYQQAKQ